MRSTRQGWLVAGALAAGGMMAGQADPAFAQQGYGGVPGTGPATSPYPSPYPNPATTMTTSPTPTAPFGPSSSLPSAGYPGTYGPGAMPPVHGAYVPMTPGTAGSPGTAAMGPGAMPATGMPDPRSGALRTSYTGAPAAPGTPMSPYGPSSPNSATSSASAYPYGPAGPPGTVPGGPLAPGGAPGAPASHPVAGSPTSPGWAAGSLEAPGPESAASRKPSAMRRFMKFLWHGGSEESDERNPIPHDWATGRTDLQNARPWMKPPGMVQGSLTP